MSQGGDVVFLIQIGLFTWIDEIHVFLQTKPSIFDAAESNTLFACENSVCFWKEYFLQNIDFKVDKGSFISK
jgi:hypothetical protein